MYTVGFIVAAALMALTVGAFLSLTITGTFLEKCRPAIKTTFGLAVAILIGCLVSCCFTLEKKTDDRLWNNGYCTECGQPYRFANTDYTKNSVTVYTWVCDNCGNVIELHGKYAKN